MNTALRAIGYTVLNIRYVSLVLPVAVFAFVSSRPETWPWLVWLLAGLLALAVAAELIASTVNGVELAKRVSAQQAYQDDMWSKITTYANGGWAGLDGSEGDEGTSEGEAGPDEGEDGGAAVPAKG